MSKLILLTTPIGNMEDIAPRTVRYLNELEYFAVEDTRSFKILGTKLGILFKDKRILSYHDHSKDDKTSQLVNLLNEGHDIAIVSEAGSPLISDPAYPLVQAALKNGHEIDSIGATSAVICALELSGLQPIPFHFHGFPPRDQGKRRSYYESLLTMPGTHIFFEGQSRVAASIKDMVAIDPAGKFAIARELTKSFQSVYRFEAPELTQVLEQMVWKGEFVLLWQNNNKSKNSGKLQDLATEILEGGAHPKKLGKLLSEITGEPPKACYEKLLQHKK